jgi:hypothetical protein
MIKNVLQFFKEKGFHIVADDVTTMVSAVSIPDKVIIIHSLSGRTMIAIKDDTNIRFAGKIENINQLKTILRLVKELPLK